MGALGNTPRRTTVVALEAAKSFAFAVNFSYAADDSPLPLTGCTVRLVAVQPQRLGGAVVLTETAVLTDAAAGESVFELQALDLALPAAEYPYTITLVTADGYSTPIDSGIFDIRTNPDADTTNTYAGINPAQALTVKLAASNQISVQVTALAGPRGNPGSPGLQGLPGISAYEVAVLEGFVGTEAEWLDSLVGPEGPQGPPGSVSSVNGKTGPAVTLNAGDVGASPTGHAHALDDLSDVDLTGATLGQALVKAASGWAPGSVASSGGSGGSPMAGTYVGTNAIGGTLETTVNRRTLYKKITITEAGLLTTVEAFIKSTGNVHGWASAVWADAGGAPGRLISTSGLPGASSLFLGESTITPNWFGQPMAAWLEPGTYWIGVQWRSTVPGTGPWQVHYSAGGTDQYSDAGGEWITSHSPGTTTATTKNYSIRANIVRGSGSAASTLLASKELTTSAAYNLIAGGATDTDVDATNAAVTFVAPASGKVTVRLSGLVSSDGPTFDWTLREGTTTVAASTMGSTGYSRRSTLVTISGLVPGSSHTYKWGSRKIGVTAGAVTMYTGGNAGSSGNAIMEVWDAQPSASAAAVSGGRVLLNEQVLSVAAASITFDSPMIPTSGYRKLVVELLGRVSAAAATSGVQLFFNGDTTASNYQGQRVMAEGASALNTSGMAAQIGYLPGTTAAAGLPGHFEITIPDYLGTTWKKTYQTRNANPASLGLYGHQWLAAAAAITQVQLVATGSTFVAGTVARIYGVN